MVRVMVFGAVLLPLGVAEWKHAVDHPHLHLERDEYPGFLHNSFGMYVSTTGPAYHPTSVTTPDMTPGFTNITSTFDFPWTVRIAEKGTPVRQCCLSGVLFSRHAVTPVPLQ
jgi:hypothetical protein